MILSDRRTEIETEMLRPSHPMINDEDEVNGESVGPLWCVFGDPTRDPHDLVNLDAPKIPFGKKEDGSPERFGIRFVKRIAEKYGIRIITV